MKRWTINEIDILINKYENTSNYELSSILNKSLLSINNKAQKLKLKKTMKYISNISSDKVSKKWSDNDNNWSDNDILILKENNNLSNIELSVLLNRDIVSIVNIKSRLGIKQDILYRDDFIIDECNKYKTKMEFRICNPNLYHWLLKNKLFEKYTKQLLNVRYSMPQLITKYIMESITGVKCIYNDRKVLYPYELDIYFEEQKFAIEYNGYYYHKDDNLLELDKFNLCKYKNIHLLLIEESNISNGSFDIYEKSIKQSIINNINLINKVFNSNINDYDIKNLSINKNKLFENFFTLNLLKELCLKYNDYTIFTKNERQAYNKLTNIGLLHEYTYHMRRYRKRKKVKL